LEVEKGFWFQRLITVHNVFPLNRWYRCVNI
jgi:hypothetical protein